MDSTFDPQLFRNFGIALLIGALVGIEREKKKSADKDLSFGGIRTFVLLAEAGAIAAWISQLLRSTWILAATILGVTLYVVASYLRQTRSDPTSVGLTRAALSRSDAISSLFCWPRSPAASARQRASVASIHASLHFTS